ncbi:MAG: SIS domain-containing protein, partial [Bacteroidia bacterium]
NKIYKLGKPFTKELELIESTFHWAIEQDTSKIQSLSDTGAPVYVVGSGGSLSACYFAVYLLQNMGITAKAITPLELYYSRHALSKSRILFLSASGKNSDILFAFKKSLESNPLEITTICMRKGTPLTKLANKYSIANAIEFQLPSGKDGFLATNSLLAYFSILHKSFQKPGTNSIVNFKENFELSIKTFLDKITTDHTITILYGGWGHPVAIDIESKFTEAALGNIHMSDYRNFAHGRHHWFAKRGKDSAIIALITPEEEGIAKKTLSILPESIPKLLITTDKDSSIGSLELLIKSFTLVNFTGQKQKIDPGRPGVPKFGRLLYNLKYSSLYNEKKKSYQQA